MRNESIVWIKKADPEYLKPLRNETEKTEKVRQKAHPGAQQLKNEKNTGSHRPMKPAWTL